MLTVALALPLVIGGSYAVDKYVFRAEVISPKEVVQKFYSDWIGYVGNPVSDKFYETSECVSDNFKKQTGDLIAIFDKGGYDPVLCAQDKPDSWEVVNVAIKGDMAEVIVDENYYGQDKNVVVILKKIKSEWKIDQIICGEGQQNNEDLNSGISPAIQTQVGDYIRENISDLSPKAEVLGGKFYVTSIVFEGPYEATVEYEDGHNAYTAKVTFRVPSANEVEIETFVVVAPEMPPQINQKPIVSEDAFFKTGNVVHKGDKLELVYEEPGKPALTAELIFNSLSVCTDMNDEKISCETYSLVNLNDGDRIRLSGIKEGNKINVKTLTILTKAINNYDECVNAGYEVMYPDCIGCKQYCETPSGEKFEIPEGVNEPMICVDKCGDGTCQEVVCMGSGCPCAETIQSCPQDCK